MSDLKNVILDELILENFKGYSNSLKFMEGKTVIKGTNKARKTTLANAWLWLTTLSDSKDRTNFELFDTTKDFTYENAIPVIVAGKLRFNGIAHELKRSAKQKWYRPRGKSEYIKDKSDEYLYYIDGLAVSAKAYKDFIEQNLAPIDKLKMMLNVRYYELLDWKVLRKHFADIVGEISDSELQGDYSSIKPLLEKYGTTDKAKEKLRQDINPLKDAVEKMESEIKGMREMLPMLDGVADAEIKIDKSNNRIAEIDAEITGIGEANNPYKEKRKAELAAIDQKESEIHNALIEWERTQNAPILEIKMRIEQLDKENARIQADNLAKKRRADSISAQIETAKQQYDYFDAERDKLKEAKSRALSKVFVENQECPNCGQPLPFDKVEELRKQFYADRDKEVASIIERGQQVRAMRDRQKELAEELEKQLAEIQYENVLDRTELERLLADATSAKLPFDDSKMRAELEEMRRNLTVIPDIDVTELVAEKKRLNDEIHELQKVVAKKYLRENDIRKIEAKENDQAKIAVELAKLEGLFDKCVEREREWAAIVRDRANKNLKYAHVEMTEISKAGEIVDICTLTADKVSAAGTNTEAQVNIGVDVANAFQKHYGLNLPLFIDNADGIADYNMPVVENQLIALYMDKDYPELTIE